MDDIIARVFEGWVKGAVSEEKHIRVYERIRDIPFAVALEFFDLENGPARMLERNKGFCVPKHLLLGEMYDKLGIPVRYSVFSFKWEELDVDNPEQLKGLAKNLPVTYHLACSAFLNGEWVFLDATWDRALGKAGFPVNDKWDGKSDTIIAVKPIEEFICEDVYEVRKMLEGRFAAYSLPEKLGLSRFSAGLNIWLEEIRGGPGR